MSSNSAEIAVEVVYAEPGRAIIRTYRLALPATIEAALAQASQDPAFAGIDLARSGVGIFGKLASHDEPLEDGDRVEIYRPLANDPKIARRARAHEARKKSLPR